MNMSKNFIYISFFIFSSVFCFPQERSLEINQNEIDFYIQEMENIYKKDPLYVLSLYDEINNSEFYHKNELVKWETDRLAANAYLVIGDIERSFKIFNNLNEKILTSLTIKLKVKFYNNIASAYKKTGNQADVLNNYNKALNLVREGKNKKSLADQLTQLGIYFYTLDSLSKAEMNLSEALDIYNDINDLNNSALTKLNLSRIDIKKRDFNSGFNKAKEARQYFENFNNTLSVSEATHLMGLCKCRDGKFGPATKLLDDAIKLANKESNTVNLAEFYTAKLELLIAKGETDSTKIYHDKILRISDSLSRSEINNKLSLFRKRLEKEKYIARLKSEEAAQEKNVSLFLSIVSFLSFLFLIIIIISFYKKMKSRNLLTEKNRELNSINSKFSAFIEQTDEAILIINSEEEIILWNKYFEKVTGIESQKALGENFRNLFKIIIGKNESSNIELYKKIELVLEGELSSFEDLELNLITDENNVTYVLANCYSITTEDEKFIELIFRDISLQKKYELELIKAKNLAVSSEKLKSEFLTQMSHEVRSPLSTILGYTNLLEQELKPRLDEDLQDSFVSINNAGKRIIRTTDLLLNVSDVQSGNYELNPVEFDILLDVIQPICDDLISEAEKKNLKLTINNKSSNNNQTADLYSTEQIIENLIDNAIKYTNEGQIEINIFNKDSNLMIEIRDTGIGIAEEYIDHLFEPFSQEEQGYTRSFEGNGLGLALVKYFCDLNNYQIKVKSEKNIGSRFILSL